MKRGRGVAVALDDLTRRVVRVMIAKSPSDLWCNDIADLLGITNTRRIYDILDCLRALGCVSRHAGGFHKWLGRPTLHHLPHGKPMRESTITMGEATQMVVRYFLDHESARRRIWKGMQLREAMGWKMRPRVLYDVLSVFRGIGLLSQRPIVEDHGVYAFAWTPEAVLPLLNDPTTSTIMIDEPIPPPPLSLISEVFLQEDKTHSFSSMDTMEFEKLLEPVELPNWPEFI